MLPCSETMSSKLVKVFVSEPAIMNNFWYHHNKSSEFHSMDAKENNIKFAMYDIRDADENWRN